MCSVDLWSGEQLPKVKLATSHDMDLKGLTPSMAFLTRSEVMSSFLARFATRAALDDPDERQAMS